MSKKLQKVGSTYKNFVITKFLPIQEIQCTLMEIIHKPTGARIMHLANNDEENLFSLAFQTIPTSSNGIAHILEHVVLCGSKKYPVKDPFFCMTRRSLHTFMNAMTGSDFTCYPASSQVEEDFYNLLEVYLDAVFHPLLTKESFLQEGHRLEFAKPSDISSPLLIKGIVYNEMKGVLSSTDARVWQSLMENLVPDLPYAYNSGGDPFAIPQLTHRELKDFHKTYYHPSHCLFFFYGSLPIKKHLDFIEEKALKNVEKLSLLLPMSEQPRFNSPKFVQDFYPISQEEKHHAKDIAAFAWLTIKASDREKVLTLALLDQILMGTDVSILKHELLSSELCTQIDSYLDSEMNEIPWVILCKGVRKDNIEELQKLLISTLKKIVKKTISPHDIASAMHQLEFSRTEIEGGSYPYGLSLFFRCALAQQYGASPEDALMIHSLFKTLRKKTSDPKYLSSFIERHFLNNMHFLTLDMRPSTTILDKESKREQKELGKIEKKLSSKGKKELIDQYEKLKTFQSALENQALDCLPKIQIKEVPHKIKDFALHHLKEENLDIFFHDVFTNQIVYVDLFFDLPHIEKEDLGYVNLFTNFLTELGCGPLTYLQSLEFQQAYIGGLSASTSLHISSDNCNECHPSFNIKAKALYHNTDKLFEIIRYYLSSPKLDDVKRIKQLLFQLSTELESHLNKSAMQYAISSSLSGLSTAASIYNQWSGIPFFQLVRKIVNNPDKEIPILIEKFKKLKNQLLNLHQMHLVLGCDKAHFEHMQKQNFYELKDLKTTSIKPWKGDYDFTFQKSHGYVLPISVAFTSMAYQSVGFTDPLSPYLLIATHLMENLILHKKIREIGGAYGAGATYSPTAGQFYFYGFRDPHIQNTVKTFHEAIEKISEGKFSPPDIEEAKLGVIQSIDAPISPGSRAYSAYVWRRTKKTKEKRQAYREKILKASKKDIQEAVKKALLTQKTKGKFVTFCSEKLFSSELGKNFPKYLI